MLRPTWLNIIVRHYGVGQKLKWHKDSIGMFEEPVYGVVLRASPHSSDGCSLEFKHGNRKYHVRKSPGALHVQEGPSRYDWAHRVSSCRSGGRVTLTWRWFRQSYVKWCGHSASIGPGSTIPLQQDVRDRWVARFMHFSNVQGLPTQVVDAFLLNIDELRDEDVPRIFGSKNEVCGPQLHAADLPRIRHSVCLHNADTVLSGKLQDYYRSCTVAAEQAIEIEAEEQFSTGIDVRILPFLRLWEVLDPMVDYRDDDRP